MQGQLGETLRNGTEFGGLPLYSAYGNPVEVLIGGKPTFVKNDPTPFLRVESVRRFAPSEILAEGFVCREHNINLQKLADSIVSRRAMVRDGIQHPMMNMAVRPILVGNTSFAA